MSLRKSLLQRLELGQLMSPNIHKPPELKLIEAMPSEPKNWDTSDVTKYS